MNDVYFKASLQNTLNPEVGTFNNVDNKEGTFTLEDGEYYLTNNTSSSYRVYYPTKDIYSVGFTIEFDVNNDGVGGFGWCLLFSDGNYWHGFGTDSERLQYRGQTLPNYHLITSTNTWLHVKCIFDYDHNQNYVDIYIDNVEVNNFIISKNYGINRIDILGNGGGFVPTAKIKNIIIYKNKEHYLDTNGLTSLWSKIKSLFATKTELASKANDSDVAHKSGDETIAGTKTFSSNIVGNLTGNSDTATKATQDSVGQQIDTTYIKGLAVSGRTITYTKGDGTTGTITTQDTNTWTAFKGATSSANGTAGYVPAPTKGNQNKFFKADGTWATPPNTTYASMSASEATTGTATAARTISAKVLHDKINSNLSAYATKTELNNGLATKANNSEVVHKSGDETIAGTKTFSDNVHASGFHATATNALMAQYGGYTLLLRNDGRDTYLLMSDKGGDPGSFNSARPLRINNPTGVCDINGNAATATNATYANWLRTSSHSDHLFHTEWDKAGYFWTYVTAGNGDYRAVRVARSDSAATAQACTGNAATATKATQDSAGQQIDTTYIKGLAVSGRTITYTKGDNTTGTITTQDTNTDTKVTQTVTTTNTEYPVLFSADANKTATSTTTARFSSNIKINPSTNTITATTFKGNLTGNVTGNASSATRATNATNAAKLDNIASSGYVQTGKVNQTINGTKTFSAAIASSIKTNTYIDGNKGVAIINSTAPAGYNMLYRIKSTNGVFTGGVFNQNYELHYTVDTTIAANTNAVTYTTTLMNEAGDATFAKNVTIGVGLTVKGDANFANITTSYIAGLFTE